MDLRPRTHWIFDLDGTLTMAVHDFAAFKASQGLPADRDILRGLETVTPQRAAEIQEALRQWEANLADMALPGPGVVDLLEHLRDQGRHLAVLTRNTRANALRTLRAAGLDHFFDHRDVAGRDSAAPKPAPDGLFRQLALWGAHPDEAVMVGDYVFDALAGRAAGTATVLLDTHGRHGHPDCADLVIAELFELTRRLVAQPPGQSTGGPQASQKS